MCRNWHIIPSAKKGIENILGQYKTPFQEFTNEIIKKLINYFAYATELLLQASFDNIEFHAANKYLFRYFYSPSFNKYIEGWGVSDEKRMIFLLK